MPGTVIYSKTYPKQEINLEELFANYESKHHYHESENDDRISSEIEADLRKLEFRLKDIPMTAKASQKILCKRISTKSRISHYQCA